MRYDHIKKLWQAKRDRIRELAQLGISQSEIAKRFGLTRQRVNKIVKTIEPT